jgi:hypothetical protein
MIATPAATTSTPTPQPPDAPATTTRSRRRRRWLPATLLTLGIALAGYTVWTNTQPVRLTTSVEIQATPEEVWAVLTDFSAYPQWNPFITSAEVTSPGGLEPGATLRNNLHDASGDTVFIPEVLVADPGQELRWLGKVGPGWIVDGEHAFQIERIGPDRVRLTQSEDFTGVLVPFIQGQLHNQTLPQFEAMNQALAQQVAATR